MPTEQEQAQFFKALQQQLPGLKSQAQFNTFQAAFEAFRGVMNAIFEGKPDVEKAAKGALTSAFEAAHKVTDLTEKLADSPEAATSKAAEEFKQPPAEFDEYDRQRTLMSELAQIKTHDDLRAWWSDNRDRIDRVKSPSLRNPLLDLVREKKVAFEQAEKTESATT